MIEKPVFYSGTSGLQTPIPKRDFPPEFADASRLTYYSSLFNSIEINSSFYKIPITKTLTKWSEEVSDHFRFTFKLWQGITHNKGLVFNPADVIKFMEVIDGVGHKKGCVLIQFPPSISDSDLGQVRHLLNVIETANEANAWKITVEFRNKLWYKDSIFDFLQEQRVGFVIHDLPASATPLISTVDDFVYLRFHGPQGGYRGSYEDDFLYEYAQYIADWLAEGKSVYAYFNNTIGNAVKNLATLNQFVNRIQRQ